MPLFIEVLTSPYPAVMPSFLHCNEPRYGEEYPWEQHLCNSAYYPLKTNATTCQPPSINRYTSNMSIIAQMKDRIGKRLDKMVAAAIDRTKRQVLTPLLKGPPDGSLEQC